jgi:hypothetical protein
MKGSIEMSNDTIVNDTRQATTGLLVRLEYTCHIHGHQVSTSETNHLLHQTFIKYWNELSNEFKGGMYVFI